MAANIGARKTLATRTDPCYARRFRTAFRRTESLACPIGDAARKQEMAAKCRFWFVTTMSIKR